jgi:hypothetical protein
MFRLSAKELVPSAALVALVSSAALIHGCNNPTCGPGTKQVQIKGGEIQCQPADGVVSTGDCDVDAGAQLVGGICVSHINCDPTTTSYDPMTGTCTGTGTMTGGLPPCPAPSAGTACVHGLLHNFVDNSQYTTPDVPVALYDPLAFLSGSPPIAMGTSTNGGYVFSNFPVPNLHLIAIAVGNLNDESVIVVAGSGAQNVNAGSIYRVDGYVIPRSVVDGWKAMTGIDYLTTGAYVAKFYGDKAPAPTDLAATETMKVSGVQLTENGTAAANAQYFSTDLTTIDTSLKSTGMEGAAIVPSPMGTPQFSGMGGMVNGTTPTWETQIGGSAAKVIFVARFHPM